MEGSTKATCQAALIKFLILYIYIKSTRIQKALKLFSILWKKRKKKKKKKKKKREREKKEKRKKKEKKKKKSKCIKGWDIFSFLYNNVVVFCFSFVL